MQSPKHGPRGLKALGKLKRVHGHGAVNSLQRIKRPLSVDNLVSLTNMRPERAEAIMAALLSGISFTRANETSKTIYDTCHWGEVTSRLSRARGSVLGSIARLLCQGRQIIQSDSQRELVLQLAAELPGQVQRLVRLLTAIPLSNEKKKPAPPDESMFDALKPATFSDVWRQLGQSRSFVRKIVRDLPLIIDKTGMGPSLDQRAKINVEASWIAFGATLLTYICENELFGLVRQPTDPTDELGVGRRYSPWLDNLIGYLPIDATIATHASPDADALVATWLAERYLFPNKRCQIRFVGRDFTPSVDMNLACVVDVGRVHQPQNRWFDHKPPAFEHRDETCTTRLLWEYLRRQGRPVDHLVDLVDLVHDGDAISRRGGSTAYQNSLVSGLHTHIKHVREFAGHDLILYRAIALWLDGLLPHI